MLNDVWLGRLMKTLSQSSSYLSSTGFTPPPMLLPTAAIARLPQPKRERSKLWELSESIHCSIIGTCLTTGELRRAMGRVVQGDIAAATDHDLHSQAVGLCNRPTPAAKVLQKALDRRHEAVLKRFSRIQGEQAVLAAWGDARRAGDIPGAYWALLTHPDVGASGVRQAFGDVHMLSHLVGSANRADIKRLTALEAENANLLAKVERQQERLHEAVTSRDAIIRRLGTLAAGRIEAAPDSSRDDEIAALRHLVADLQGRLDRAAEHHTRAGRIAAEASKTAAQWETRARSAGAEAEVLRAELGALEHHERTPGGRANLPPERILYVGGRPGCVGQIRALLDASGGTLLAHGGGRHDHPSLLPGLISQADRVAFPVDCVSHDAALAVKRICRQLGRAWVPLRSSGLASFLAAFAPPSEVAP